MGKTHYPQNRQPELLDAFVESVRFLSEREQQKAIDLADSWLQEQPDNAPLLMYLGQLGFGRKLWGKAQGYLEASIALQPSVSAHLVLARVFDETDQPQKHKNNAIWFWKRGRRRTSGSPSSAKLMF